MRSSLEIIQHLKEKEYGDAVIQEAIHKLKELKYIDDEVFAQAYVRTNARVSLKGPTVLKQELAQKGIAGNLVENALLAYTEQEQFECAAKVAEKTGKKTRSSSRKIQEQKITEALLRKGFTSHIITKILSEELTEKDEGEEWDALCKAGAKAHRRYQKLSGREFEYKMKQSLYQKGFDLDLIDRFLQSEEWQEMTSETSSEQSEDSFW
jgi:regulatory protein